MRCKSLFPLAFVALLLACAGNAAAQATAANYTFATTTTGSLTDMSSGTTTLVAADQDDTASAVTMIGFDFYFMGVRQDRFSVNSNGSLRFGSTMISTTAYDPLAQVGQSLVTAYGADQRVHITGRVHTKTIGTAPNRVRVVEWLNMQSTFNAGNTADLTYQVRLHETTGVIEFVYGAMTMSAAGAADSNSSSPQFGFSTNNTANTVGTLTVPQSGTPGPSYASASAPVNNPYVAGSIDALTSAADGTRRTFTLTPPQVEAPGGPLTFTGVTTTTTTLSWTDASNETGYAVYLSADGGATYKLFSTLAQNATSLAATGLFGGVPYSWRVDAINEGTAASLTGVQITTTPTLVTSTGSGLWSSPGTWSTGAVPNIDSAVLIASGHTVTIDTAAAAHTVAVMNGAVLQFEQTTARTLIVAADVALLGGTLRSNPAGTQSGHSLTLAGDLLNDGTLDLSTNADTAGAGITFSGRFDAGFTGPGATTDVRSINVNKGSTPDAAIVELAPDTFTVRGSTSDTVVGGWLVMTGGTLKIGGTFPMTSRTFATAGYTIPATFGFWLDNPNYVVAAQNGNATNNGVLRIVQGTYNQGTTGAAAFTGAAGAVFTIEGGTVNVAGRFAPTAAVVYNQSGGTFNVSTVGNTGNTVNTASFGLSATATTFNMTGGTINLVQAGTNASGVDYNNAAGNLVATAGTLRAGTSATTTNFNFRIRGNLPNFVVDNTGFAKTATAVAQINLNGTTLINSGTTLTISNQVCVVLGPTFTNNGTLTGLGGTTRFYFLGTTTPATYTGTGTVTAPLRSFEVDNTAGVTIDPGVNPIVTSRVNILGGGVTGADRLTIGNGSATASTVQFGVTGASKPITGFDVAPAFDLGTGGLNLIYAPEIGPRTTGPEIPPSRTLAQLTITNPNPITIAGGDLEIDGSAAGALGLGSTRLITGSHTVFVSTTTGTITRTTGYVDGALKRTIPNAGASPWFDVGTANGYSPVNAVFDAGTFPADVTVRAVQSQAPGVPASGRTIDRHWIVDAPGVTQTSLTFMYLDADLASVTEADLHLLRRDGGSYTDLLGTFNAGSNTMQRSNVTSFGVFTLGEATADLSITNTDGATSVAAGGTVTYTLTAGNAGTVTVSGATVTDDFPADLTCTWTCAGANGGSCTLSGSGDINDAVTLPAGGTATYTATCTVGVTATGTLSNTASIAPPLGVVDPVGGNDAASDTDTAIVPLADLAITHTDGVTTAAPGGTVTYAIVARNLGPAAAVGATVTDDFPAELTCTWTCVGAGGGTCTAAGSGDIGDTVNLPAGGSAAYTASCAIAQGATGSLVNTASVAAPGTVSDPTSANDSITDTDVLVPSADLSITKTDGATTASPGGSVIYTITAANAGPSDANAIVEDDFPAEQTCTWTCAGAGGGTCTLSGNGDLSDAVMLPDGGSVTYTASCAIAANATGTTSNTATVTSQTADPNPGSESANDTDTLVPQADLGIAVDDGVTAATPGGSVTYTIVATNAGPSVATGATVTDAFPPQLTCTWMCAGAGNGTCTSSGSGAIADTVTLPVGGSATYTATCAIAPTATGSLVNGATIAPPAGTTDPNALNDADSDTDALGAEADLSIANSDGVTAATPGGSVTYTIVAANAGPSAVTGATVTDTFPSAATCTWTCAGAGGGTCTLSGSGDIADTVTLPAGGSVTYTATCAIAPNATGSLINVASVAAPGTVTDPTPGNNLVTDTDALGAEADLAITNTDGVTTATPGGSVTYTIVASNAGPSAAIGATVTDTFPTAATCTWTCAGAGGGTCTSSGSGNIGDTVTLPAGGSLTYTATCAIAPNATGSLINVASVAAPGTVTDPTPGNNLVTDTDALGAEADLAITNTDGLTTATPGGSVTYTIVASNAGPSAAIGATVTDTFPTAATCTWTCTGAGGGTCTLSGSGDIADTVTLPADGSVTYTATCAIASNATGSLVNVASVAAPGTITDPTPGNDSVTDTDMLAAQANLSITNTDGVTTATPGGSVTYTIVATNAGPSAATGATVTDTFPTAATCTWTCTGAGGGTCTSSGSGNIADTVTLPAGGSVTYTATCAIASNATGSLVNVATIAAPAGVADTSSGNDTATDTDTVASSADASITATDGLLTLVAGNAATYTIVAANAGPSPLSPATVAATFPAAAAGCTWTCANGSGTCGAASGSGDVSDAPVLPAGAAVTYTATCTVPASTADGTVLSTSASIATGAVDDPNAGDNAASDTTTVSATPMGANVTGTMTVAGTLARGGTITYTVVLSNAGPGAQNDNPGDEFVDVLPAGLTLVSASATSGSAAANVGTRTVRWNGGIAAGASVTITIVATIDQNASGQIVNQGTIAYDGNGDGTNDATALTDDPGAPGNGNGTGFGLAPLPAIQVPATDLAALIALMLGVLAVTTMRRSAIRRMG